MFILFYYQANHLALNSFPTRRSSDLAFEPENDTNLRRLMSVPETQLGLGIPAGTALAIRNGGETEIIGSGHVRSEEHTSELQSHHDIVCRLLLEKKKV